MTLTRPWGAVAEAGKALVRKTHLRPRRGGGSRASGGRLNVCGHYPRGSRQRRDRCLIGASALLGICTKRLEGTSAAPTGNPGWRLRHTGCVLRADAALCLTNEPARLSSGRWPAAPRGDAKGGNALWRAFASFWRVPKGWRRAGAQPRPGMPPGAMPRQAHGSAQGVAAWPGETPPHGSAKNTPPAERRGTTPPQKGSKKPGRDDSAIPPGFCLKTQKGRCMFLLIQPPECFPFIRATQAACKIQRGTSSPCVERISIFDLQGATFMRVSV